jgi:hypothetical protein
MNLAAQPLPTVMAAMAIGAAEAPLDGDMTTCP